MSEPLADDEDARWHLDEVHRRKSRLIASTAGLAIVATLTTIAFAVMSAFVGGVASLVGLVLVVFSVNDIITDHLRDGEHAARCPHRRH